MTALFRILAIILLIGLFLSYLVGCQEANKVTLSKEPKKQSKSREKASGEARKKPSVQNQQDSTENLKLSEEFKNLESALDKKLEKIKRETEKVKRATAALRLELVQRTGVPAWAGGVVPEMDTWQEVVEIGHAVYWAPTDDPSTIGKTVAAYYGGGEISEVIGWSALPNKEGWLVSYTWNGKHTKPDEVDGNGQVIPINGNPQLEKKYGINWDAHQRMLLSKIHKEK